MGHAWSSLSTTLKAHLGVPAQPMQVTWESPKAVENAKVTSIGIQTTPELWTGMETMLTTLSDHGPNIEHASGKRKCSGELDESSAVLQHKKVKSLVSEEDYCSQKFVSGHSFDSQCWSNKLEEPSSKHRHQSSTIEDLNFQPSEETRKARDVDSLNAIKTKSQLGTSKDLGAIIDNVNFIKEGITEYSNGSEAHGAVHVRDKGNKVLDLGTGKLMLGAHVNKQFGDGTFERGRVISYDESLKLYKVQYTDKTSEILEWLDLEPILLYEQQNGSIIHGNNTDTRPSRWPKQRSLNQLIARNKRSKRHRGKVKNMHYKA